MPQELEDAIKSDAQGPSEVRSDDLWVRQHRLKDQIEADRYLESNKAVRKKLGIKRTKMIPPGAV